MRLLRITLALLLLVGVQTSVMAQRPYLGLSAGPVMLPGVFELQCGRTSLDASPTPGAALQARVGYALGRVSIEGTSTASVTIPPVGPVCPDNASPGADDRYEYRDVHVSGGGYLASDVRLRRQWNARVPIALSAGGGWVWSVGAPLVVAGAGIRWGSHRVRGVLDADWQALAIPYDNVVLEQEATASYRESSRTRTRAWRSAAGLRLGFELGL